MRGRWLMVVAYLMAVKAAAATTYSVTPDGLGDFPTIQAAVDAAVDGDVIELGDGVFSGLGNRDIVVRVKEIFIRSESADPFRCVIDCESTPGAFGHFGFRFESHRPGGELANVMIINGYANRGGAVHIESSDTRVVGCVFYKNEGNHGGAVDCDSGCESALIRCSFVDNDATYGGGLCI